MNNLCSWLETNTILGTKQWWCCEAWTCSAWSCEGVFSPWCICFRQIRPSVIDSLPRPVCYKVTSFQDLWTSESLLPWNCYMDYTEIFCGGLHSYCQCNYICRNFTIKHRIVDATVNSSECWYFPFWFVLRVQIMNFLYLRYFITSYSSFLCNKSKELNNLEHWCNVTTCNED